MMGLGVVLFGSNLFVILCASCICMSISFAKLGKFSFIIFSNKLSISYSYSSFSGILDSEVGMFGDAPEASYTILIFYFYFLILISSLCSL